MRSSFAERAELTKAPLAKRLFNLMAEKETNLALSADVTNSAHLLQLADQLGPEICVLKTHIDIIEDFSQDLLTELLKLAERHQFLLFEDRKFADIGHTVKMQYSSGIYRIAEWADLINAYTIPGPGIVSALAEIGAIKQRGLILIAELSSHKNLLAADAKQAALELAKIYPDFVIGFITQHALGDLPGLLNFTPGIQLEAGADNLGQRYTTPETAILQHGADVIIVGRGILASANPLAKARAYRERCFDLYQQRIASG